MKIHKYHFLPQKMVQLFLTLIAADSLYLLGCSLLYRCDPPAAAALIHIPQLPVIYEHLLMSLTLTLAGVVLFAVAEKERA